MMNARGQQVKSFFSSSMWVRAFKPDPRLDISTLPAKSFCWPQNMNTFSETHLCHSLSIYLEVFTKLSCQNHYAKLPELGCRTLTVVAQN